MVDYILNKGHVIVIDKSKPINLKFKKRKKIKFFLFNIRNEKKISQLLNKYHPNYLINFAAETHVDKSIDNPKKFIESNINGVFSILN